LLAPFLLVLALYLLLRHVAFGNPIESDVADLPQFARYLPSRLALLVVPLMRDLWQQEVRVLALLASAANGILVVLFCVSVYRERRALASARPMLLLGCAWYSITLLPLVARSWGLYDRYLYIPSAGLCLAVAPSLVALCRHRSGARRAAAGLGMVLFLLINAGVLVSMNEAWVRSGRASRRLHFDFSRLAASIPKGSFVVFLNPPVGARRLFVWDCALPSAFQEPFSPVYRDLVIIETPEVYCCPAEVWWQDKRASFQDLLTRPSPVYLAFWDHGQGRLRTAGVNPEALACFRQQMRGVRVTRATALSLVPSLIAVPPKCPAGPTGTPPVR
jgi:hypothetical protein